MRETKGIKQNTWFGQRNFRIFKKSLNISQNFAKFEGPEKYWEQKNPDSNIFTIRLFKLFIETALPITYHPLSN